MKIALLGFGTVGYGVYEIAAKVKGLDIAYVLDLKKHEGLTAKSVTDITPILEDSSVETVVELIGGLHPAYEFVRASLEAGKNVVTANKFLICEYYEELNKLAAEKGVSLRFTASVGGGIPWLINLQRIKRFSSVSKIVGILNGTTNFILDSMHKNGSDFSEVLAEAQRLGYAEADPSADIDALDTIRKIIISSNIAFSGVLDNSSVNVFGIRNITFKDIKAAEDLGKVVRLLATAEKTDEGLSVYCEPTMVDKASPFASVSDSFNRISVTSDYEGEAAFFGYGAGRYPTAYAVLGDLVDLLEGSPAPYSESFDRLVADNTASSGVYYIRTTASIPEEMVDKRLEAGILTKPVSVAKIHEIKDEAVKTDSGFFFARVI